MAKKKPPTQEIRPDFLTRFQVKGNEPLAEQPVTVRLPISVDGIVRSLPNRAEWLRNTILAQLKEEGLLQPDQDSDSRGAA